MKILNLYAGIGGNRKLWGKEYDITAIEWDDKIAKIYQDFFPDDTVIITDAHQYLLEHYDEFDFIWSSPPCPTHSRIRNEAGVGSGNTKPIYPEMNLYQEILFLQHMFKLQDISFNGKYVIENVISYYKPLIEPQTIALHYFWANFFIREFNAKTREHYGGIDKLEALKGFNLDDNIIGKRLLLRNCVEPELGKHILDCAIGKSLF